MGCVRVRRTGKAGLLSDELLLEITYAPFGANCTRTFGGILNKTFRGLSILPLVLICYRTAFLMVLEHFNEYINGIVSSTRSA